jgi:MscS family membrane protein
VYPWGTDKLLNMMPKTSEKAFLGVKLWQYMGLLVLFVASWLIFVVLNFILSFLVSRIVKVESKFVEKMELMAVIRPISLFFVAVLLKYFFPILQLPIIINYLFRLVLRVATPTFGLITIYYIIEVFGAVGNRFANKTNNTLDNQLIPLIQKVLRFVIILFGVIFIFQNVGVNVTALIAGVSIGGLAFALAAQDTVKNFLGSVTILLDAPFQIGDYIEFDGKAGYVEEVGLRSTRLRTLDGTIISVPNSKVADAAVNNIGRRVERTFSPKLFINANYPLERVELFVKEMREFLDTFPLGLKEKNKIYLYNLNGRSLQVLLDVHYDTLVVKESQVKEQTLAKILELSQKHQIRFV